MALTSAQDCRANIRDVFVVEREGPHVRSDIAQNVADAGKGGEDDPVEGVREGDHPGHLSPLLPHAGAGVI
jgi:hypothetical protein